MHIVVGSENPLKLKAVRHSKWGLVTGTVIGRAVESGEPAQPIGYEQIGRGAKRRASGALEIEKAADLGFGLESGVIKFDERYLDTGLVVCIGRTGIIGRGATVGVPVPQEVALRIQAGQEMVEALAEAYQLDDIQDRDCVSVLTGGRLSGVAFYQQAATLALTDYLQQAPALD